MPSMEERFFAGICALIYLFLALISFYEWAAVPKNIIDIGGHLVGMSTVASQIKFNPYGVLRSVLVFYGVCAVYSGCLADGWMRKGFFT
jgi:phosphotransferase system  glucose/maltose/N-acetylglucosamine-specific IIC component